MITSVHNPTVQSVRKLLAQAKERRAQGAFVIEGVRLSEEALLAGWEVQLVLFTDQLDQRGQAVVEGFSAKGISAEQVSSGVMNAISDTETPQGILAVLPMKSLPYSSLTQLPADPGWDKRPRKPGHHPAQRDCRWRTGGSARTWMRRCLVSQGAAGWHGGSFPSPHSAPGMVRAHSNPVQDGGPPCRYSWPILPVEQLIPRLIFALRLPLSSGVKLAGQVNNRSPWQPPRCTSPCRVAANHLTPQSPPAYSFLRSSGNAAKGK